MYLCGVFLGLQPKPDGRTTLLMADTCRIEEPATTIRNHDVLRTVYGAGSETALWGYWVTERGKVKIYYDRRRWAVSSGRRL